MHNDQTTDRTLPRGITSSVFNGEDLTRLYGILRGNSELSKSTIERELGTALRRMDQGSHFLSGDIRDLGLGVEELAFIIEHNRYQEKSACADGESPRIDVRGSFGERQLFFISEDVELSSRVHEDIVSLLVRGGAPARLSAYRIEGPAASVTPGWRTSSIPALAPKRSRSRPSARRGAHRSRALGFTFPTRGSLSSSARGSRVGHGAAQPRGRGRGGAPLRAWIARTTAMAAGEEIAITLEDSTVASARCVRVCVSRERCSSTWEPFTRLRAPGARFIRESRTSSPWAARSGLALRAPARGAPLRRPATFLQSELSTALAASARAHLGFECAISCTAWPHGRLP